MKRKPIPPLTDEEEARVQKMIASDPDNPELTDEQMAQAKPFAEVFPDLAASIKRSRGRPKVISPKQAVTLRLSPETVARYKSLAGVDWRAHMTNALAAALDEKVVELEPVKRTKREKARQRR